jgi:3-deoxy-D-manno-octulosonate 8-phosphate phosphatase (KDO 8-P phosphatase)
VSTCLISPDEFSVRAKQIRLVCFDVDGTLTDGRLFFDEHGGELKAFHVHDGQGLRLLEDSGIAVALITARDSKIVRARGQDLRLKHVFVGIANKLKLLKELCQREAIELSEVAYMGDDLPDLACLQSVGLAACPSDALDVIQQNVHWRSNFIGGAGAARQFCDAILHAQNKHNALLTRFSAP